MGYCNVLKSHCLVKVENRGFEGMDPKKGIATWFYGWKIRLKQNGF